MGKPTPRRDVRKKPLPIAFALVLPLNPDGSIPSTNEILRQGAAFLRREVEAGRLSIGDIFECAAEGSAFAAALLQEEGSLLPRRRRS